MRNIVFMWVYSFNRFDECRSIKYVKNVKDQNAKLILVFVKKNIFWKHFITFFFKIIFTDSFKTKILYCDINFLMIRSKLFAKQNWVTTHGSRNAGIVCVCVCHGCRIEIVLSKMVLRLRTERVCKRIWRTKFDLLMIKFFTINCMKLKSVMIIDLSNNVRKLLTHIRLSTHKGNKNDVLYDY